MGCGCSMGPRLKDVRLQEGSEGQLSARELLRWHLRMDVEAGPDGHGSVTCLVDSEADVARVRVTVMTRDGRECARVDEKAAFSVNWAQPQTRKMSIDWKVENPLVWTDERPVLYFARLELLDAHGVQRAVSLARFAFFRMDVRADDYAYRTPPQHGTGRCAGGMW